MCNLIHEIGKQSQTQTEHELQMLANHLFRTVFECEPRGDGGLGRYKERWKGKQCTSFQHGEYSTQTLQQRRIIKVASHVNNFSAPLRNLNPN
jgi:hypothetical protein